MPAQGVEVRVLSPTPHRTQGWPDQRGASQGGFFGAKAAPLADRIPGRADGGGYDGSMSNSRRGREPGDRPVDVSAPVVHPTAFVAPGVHIHGDVRILERAVIMFGTAIRAEFDRIEVGAGSNVQDNAVLHIDEGFPCVVGSHTTVGHSAVLHGALVGDHCLVGIGAKALSGSVMGEGSWLASGAILPEGREIPPWTLAMGIPAKPVRELTEAEVERQRSGVEAYQQLAAAYRLKFEKSD